MSALTFFILKYSWIVFLVLAGFLLRKDIASLFQFGGNVISRKSLEAQTFRSSTISAYLRHLRDNFGPARSSFSMAEVMGIRENSIDNARRVLTLVAKHMEIPCRIVLKTSSEKVSADHGHSSAAAWVYARGLPHYSSSEFKACTVRMYIHEEQFVKSEMDVHWIVNMLAHECSHIILHAMRDPFADSEMMTDMLAIHYGFDEAYLRVNGFDLSDPRAMMQSLAEEEFKRQIDGPSEYNSRLENLFVVLAVREEKYTRPLRLISDFLKNGKWKGRWL